MVENRHDDSSSKRDYYCFDTSALIKIGAEYPPHIFPGIWRRLENLVASGRLVSPKAVRDEFKPRSKVLENWAKRNRRMFIRPTREQMHIVAEINSQFRGLTDEDRETEQADPFVIALATEAKRRDLFESYVVVTMEKIRGNRVRIPLVCADPRYSIECIDVLEFFEREGWEFD